MDDANPRAIAGGNRPPLDQPDDLKPRLERDHAELIAAIAQAELERFALPEEPATDEECAQLTEFVIKLKGLAKRLEDQRTAEGRPYLDGQRVVNAFFGAFSADLDKQTDARTGELTKRIGAYARARAAREQAERIEKERLQREEARRLEQEAEDKRKAAEESQRQADEAAAKIRAAETPEAREEAFAEMRQAETHADILRDQAEEISGSAAQADRRADTQGRAADANIGKLSRVSSAGATSSVTETWGHAIADAEALLKSLGPLGPHISNTEISAALSRAVTVHERAGTVETLAIPGVNIFRDHRTNIRARRT